MKEGRDGAHLIASVKPFQTLGPEYEMHFWPIDLLHFGRANSEEVVIIMLMMMIMMMMMMIMLVVIMMMMISWL